MWKLFVAQEKPPPFSDIQRKLGYLYPLEIIHMSTIQRDHCCQACAEPGTSFMACTGLAPICQEGKEPGLSECSRFMHTAQPTRTFPLWRSLSLKSNTRKTPHTHEPSPLTPTRPPRPRSRLPLPAPRRPALPRAVARAAHSTPAALCAARAPADRCPGIRSNEP